MNEQLDLENSLDRLFLKLWNPNLWVRIQDDYGNDAGMAGMVAEMRLGRHIQEDQVICDNGVWFYGERFSEWACCPRYMPGVRILRQAREFMLCRDQHVAERWARNRW